jgi:hypothetical protein
MKDNKLGEYSNFTNRSYNDDSLRKLFQYAKQKKAPFSKIQSRISKIEKIVVDNNLSHMEKWKKIRSELQYFMSTQNQYTQTKKYKTKKYKKNDKYKQLIDYGIDTCSAYIHLESIYKSIEELNLEIEKIKSLIPGKAG